MDDDGFTPTRRQFLALSAVAAAGPFISGVARVPFAQRTCCACGTVDCS